MKRFSTNQWIGIALLISAIFMFVNIPLIDEKTIAAIVVVILGIWNLIR